MMENRRCGRDRIAAEEHRQMRKLRPGDKAERDALGAGQRAIEAGFGGRRRDMMLLERSREFGGFAIGMARIERRDIRFGKIGILGEFRLQPLDQRLAVAVEHPQRKAERPHILAAQRFLVAEPERFDRIHCRLTDVELQQLPFRKAAILERVGVIFRLGEIAVVEFAFVGDDQAAELEHADIGLERRGVHRDEHVGGVARGRDLARPEIDLERRNTEQRALRRADFGWKIGEGRQVIARERRRKRELTTGKLHPVAAVACETNHHCVGKGGLPIFGPVLDHCRHFLFCL